MLFQLIKLILYSDYDYLRNIYLSFGKNQHLEKRLIARCLVLVSHHQLSLPVGNISEDLKISMVTVKNILKNYSGKMMESKMFQLYLRKSQNSGLLAEHIEKLFEQSFKDITTKDIKSYLKEELHIDLSRQYL